MALREKLQRTCCSTFLFSQSLSLVLHNTPTNTHPPWFWQWLMLIQEACFLQHPWPPRWMCTWDRTRWKPHSPTFWEQTALQSLGRGGKAAGSQAPRLQIGSGMWGWSWGRRLSPTQEQSHYHRLVVSGWIFPRCQRDKLELQADYFIMCCAGVCVCVCVSVFSPRFFTLISAVDAPTFSCRIVVFLGLFSARLAL